MFSDTDDLLDQVFSKLFAISVSSSGVAMLRQ